MVYNALKLFMEINPDLFDEAMQQYKQRRAEYVRPIFCKVPHLTAILRDQDQAVRRYEAWQKLREQAKTNAPGGKLPNGYVEIEHPPPPPPSAVDDADIMDLSMELNAVSIEDVPGDLDERGMERVPMADPGVEVRLCPVLVGVLSNSRRRSRDHSQRFHATTHH